VSVEEEKVSFERVPRHLAVIMDGNGRWARERGLERIRGHQEGAKSAREVTEECVRIGGIEQLTLYALSYDNLHKRPRSEIDALLKLLRKYINEQLSRAMEKNIRLAVIGEMEDLPAPLGREIAEAIRKTASNTGMTFCLALNYSARREIAHAARELAQLVKKGELSPAAITEKTVEQHLFTAAMPDVDLLIRSGGDMRVSDFLLWQISYAEIFVSKAYWPDFRRRELHEALRWYAGRQRRFGAIKET
jgi:undecaprenyl diphosphate synthase